MLDSRFRWFGQVARRNSNDVGMKEPKRRFMETLKEDMMVVGASEEDAEERC